MALWWNKFSFSAYNDSSEPYNHSISLCVAGLHGAMPAPKEEQHEADEEYSYEDDLEGEESESDTTVLPNMPQPQNMPPAPPAAPASLSQRPVRGRSPVRGTSARSKSWRDKDQEQRQCQLPSGR